MTEWETQELEAADHPGWVRSLLSEPVLGCLPPLCGRSGHARISQGLARVVSVYQLPHPWRFPWGPIRPPPGDPQAASPHPRNALLSPASAFTWEVKANSRAYNNQFKEKAFLCWQRKKYKVSGPGPAALCCLLPTSLLSRTHQILITNGSPVWCWSFHCVLSPAPVHLNTGKCRPAGMAQWVSIQL